MVLSRFSRDRKLLEDEGVYIGGWSLKNLFAPSYKDGKPNSGEDRAENNALAVRDWTDEEEKALVRKLDMRVLLPCFIIYVLAYMDRSNLGNINVMQSGLPSNIQNRLSLQGSEFNWAVSAPYFMVTVMLFPSNILLKKYGAKVFLPILMVLWGIVVMSISATKNAAGLISSRFFLGVPESVPCCILYFSFWYKPSERAFRMGIFDSANALASAISGFLAIAIGQLDGKGGLDGWQWLLLIEGLIPIVCAIPIYFALLTFPETTAGLSEREKYIAINRFGRGSTRSTDATWDRAAFVRIMTRPSTYIFFVSFTCLCTVAVGLANFLPTILSTFLKFSSTQSNLYTAVTNLVALPLFWVVGWHSDWTRERMWHYLIPALLSIPGFAVWTYVANNPGVRDNGISTVSLYGMAFLAQMVRIGQPVILSYRSSTLYGSVEQSTGGAAVVASLSIASILGPQMYPKTDAPRYIAGFTATCVLLGICIVSYALLPVALMFEAQQRKKKTGHALPLQAMRDSENSQVSAATLARFHEMNVAEGRGTAEKTVAMEEGQSVHVEEAGRKDQANQ
ncbi:MFS general substrate transporter [Thozetella sp. PMI_491]|nr:MFS general substrate transporter [Thozetella sp. PMI_491]